MQEKNAGIAKGQLYTGDEIWQVVKSKDKDG